MVSKAIEKAVAVQLTAYVSSRPPPTLRVTVSLQALHSTETSLIRVENKILCAIDSNHSLILLLLDLSVAFDTADHSILLSIKTKCF